MVAAKANIRLGRNDSKREKASEQVGKECHSAVLCPGLCLAVITSSCHINEINSKIFTFCVSLHPVLSGTWEQSAAVGAASVVITLCYNYTGLFTLKNESLGKACYNYPRISL